MKPHVWRGKSTGRWWVDTCRDSGEAYPGTLNQGYETWREAYDATCLAIAADPA
ncbi:hypothetical protein [Microbacterium sp. PF5]|uniref:hypothetical protein n=1 Tax=Microbacterium sp. PF5 TaxID=2305435 RepID=UPI0014441E92|nr:hypothetical protein [Microbacterium sp. PF5]